MRIQSGLKRSAGLSRALYIIFVVALPTAWMAYSLASNQPWIHLLPPVVLTR